MNKTTSISITLVLIVLTTIYIVLAITGTGITTNSQPLPVEGTLTNWDKSDFGDLVWYNGTGTTYLTGLIKYTASTPGGGCQVWRNDSTSKAGAVPIVVANGTFTGDLCTFNNSVLIVQNQGFFVVTVANNVTHDYSYETTSSNNAYDGNFTWRYSYYLYQGGKITDNTADNRFREVYGLNWSDTCLTGCAAAANTCTYTSGDWNVVLGDNCNVTTTVQVYPNNVKLTGTGTFNIRNGGLVRAKGIYFQPTSLSGTNKVTVDAGGALHLQS